jgi:hypothetical protein
MEKKITSDTKESAYKIGEEKASNWRKASTQRPRRSANPRPPISASAQHDELHVTKFVEIFTQETIQSGGQPS